MKQKMFFSDEEIELIKITFGGNPPELWQLRNHLWQFEDEKPKFSKDVLKLLRKVIIPECGPEIPLHQQRSLYSSLAYIRESNPEIAYLHILSNDIYIQYLTQQWDELCGEIDDENRIVLTDLPKKTGLGQEEIRFTNMLAYHRIIGTIDGKIAELEALANPPKQETPDEAKKRLEADSAK